MSLLANRLNQPNQLEALDQLDLGDEWLRAVRWHNEARLMRLA